jgi:hypothetical protein
MELVQELPQQMPPGYRCEEEISYVLAADLGQSTDPTAIAVMEHRQIFHHHYSGIRTQVGERFDVRHLMRLPLGLSYPAVVQEVAMLLARKPIAGQCELIIDETGVGRAVADIFDATGLKPTRVSITAGSDQTRHGLRGWHVAKQILISTLDARLHTGELRFAAELLEAGAMQEELKDFRRKVSAAGRYAYEARVGKHDDLVLAVAIALWAVVGRPKPPVAAFGTFRNAF